MNRTQYTFFSIILISLVFTLSGCKKDADRIIIEGVVTDPVQMIAVDNADVYLYGKVFEGGMFNPDPVVIASASTDNLGKFSINTEKIKASDFELHVVKKNYFTIEESLTLNEIASGKAYRPAFDLFPMGWLKLRIQNYKPFNSSDMITYRIISDNPVCYDCCSNKYVKGIGTEYDSVTVCRSKGGKEITISYLVFRGDTTIDSVSLVLPVFDTLFYHLKY